jgi:ABC-2 type transport system ATP-binding protein/bacitracin transport system ATP-binding protein
MEDLKEKKGNMEMGYLIETRNLKKQYGKTIVVNDVSVHVPKGKIYALLGRNGAGKTTLMKMLLRLIRSTSGEIYLFGTRCEKTDCSIYRQIGSIIETPGFYENLTAFDNLTLLMRLRGQGKREDIMKALEMVGLHHEYLKPFSDYSLGMKQRLGIAAALMHEPKLLILDEPINGLDPIGISEIRALLTSLCRDKGTTIFVSSHVLSEIEQIADVIGVMHKGQLIEEIKMEALQNRRHEYIEFEVSDMTKALEILENSYGITNCQVQGNTLKVFDTAYNCGMINKTFVENGLMVTKINQTKENLEDYFSELIGGGGIA